MSAANMQRMTKMLGGQEIPVRIGFSSSGVRLAGEAVGSPAGSDPAIEVNDGQVSVQIDVAAIERLILSVGNNLAAEHGVKVEHVQLQLRQQKPRSLDLVAAVKARRGFFAAAVELTGQVVVDRQLHARVANLNVRGQGVLGTMVASVIRPKLRQVADQPIILTSLVPGVVALQDVEFHVTEQLGVTLHLGPSRISLGGSGEQPAAANATAGESRAASGKERPSLLPAGLRNKRLDIFVIDSGWNPRASEILEDHFRLFDGFLRDQNIFRLSGDQSKQVLKRSPELIGSDPILMVLDSDMRVEQPQAGYGFRFCLGAVSPENRCGDELKRVLTLLTQRGPSKRTSTTGDDPDGAGNVQLLIDLVGG